MDECHGAKRVVDAVPTIGESVLHRKHEARTELTQRTPRVHQGRRVGFEPALGHEPIELLRQRLDPAFTSAVASVGLGDHRRHAPEQILRRLDGLPRLILDEIALLEDDPGVRAQLRGCRRARGGVIHVTAPMKKKTRRGEPFRGNCVVRGWGRESTLLVIPRKCSIKRPMYKTLHYPHHKVTIALQSPPD